MTSIKLRPPIIGGGGSSAPFSRPLSSGSGRNAAAGAARGIGTLAAGLAAFEEENRRLDAIQADQAADDFINQVNVKLDEFGRTVTPGSTTVMQDAGKVFDQEAQEFISTVKTEQQPHVARKVNKARIAAAARVRKFDIEQRDAFSRQNIKDKMPNALRQVAETPDALEAQRAEVAARINASTLSEQDKVQEMRKWNREMEMESARKRMLEYETGMTTGPGDHLPLSQDNNGFWHTPGLKYSLQGKTRDKPVSRDYVSKVMGVVKSIGPEFGVQITSGGQTASRAPGAKFTGSRRHDVTAEGVSETADLLITRNGKAIKPGENKELYKLAFKGFAAAGFTGLGHYSGHIHVGGGSQVFWGPNGQRATADPDFREAARAGALLREGGIAADPAHSNLSFADIRQLRREAKIQAKGVNKSAMVARVQGIVDSVMQRSGGDFTDAIDIVKKTTNGAMTAEVMKALNTLRTQELGAFQTDKALSQESNLVRWQQLARTAIEGHPTLMGALMSARDSLEGTDLAEVEKRIEADFELRSKITARDTERAAPDMALKLIELGKDDASTLEIANLISDPTLREETKKIIRREFKDKSTIEVKSRVSTAQQFIKNATAQGLKPNAIVADAEAKLDGEVQEEVKKQIKARKARAETQRKEEVREAKARATKAIISGEMTVQEYMDANPADRDLLSEELSNITNLQKAEDNVNEGRLFARTSDGKTEDAILGQDVSVLAANDPSEDPRYALLTESEQGRVMQAHRNAKARLQASAENNQTSLSLERTIRKFMPRSARKRKTGQEVIKLSQAQQNLLFAEGRDWLRQFTDVGKRPTPEQMASFAAVINMEVESDISFLPFGEISGVGGEFASPAFLATLSQAERDAFRVDFDSIPPTIMQSFRTITDKTGVRLTEDLAELIAGALATRQVDRANKLLGRR